MESCRGYNPDASTEGNVSPVGGGEGRLGEGGAFFCLLTTMFHIYVSSAEGAGGGGSRARGRVHCRDMYDLPLCVGNVDTTIGRWMKTFDERNIDVQLAPLFCFLNGLIIYVYINV